MQGGSLLTSPDHALHHRSLGTAVNSLQTTVGTTAGTNVLKNFALGNFPVRQNVGGTLLDTLTGGTHNSFIGGTVSLTGGTHASALHSGTASFSAGTYAVPVITGGVSLSANGSITQTSTADHITLTPGANKVVRGAVLENGNGTLVFRNTVIIATGWFNIPIALGAHTGLGTVTFGSVTFTTKPIVVAQLVGFTTATGTALTDIGVYTTSFVGVGLTQGFGVDSITTTGFKASLFTSANAGADVSYGVGWVAYGVGS